MKILKQGKLPSTALSGPYRGECKYCGCQVEVTPNEGHVQPIIHHPLFAQTKCPTEGCKEYIILMSVIDYDKTINNINSVDGPSDAECDAECNDILGKNHYSSYLIP